MKDETTPTTSRPDPFVGVLYELTAAIESQAEAIGRVASEAARSVKAVLDEFRAWHAEAQKGEAMDREERRRLHADVRLLRGELRNALGRITNVEGRVAGTELELEQRRDENGHGIKDAE